MSPTILASTNPLDHVVQHAFYTTAGGLTVLSDHILMMVIAAVLVMLVLPRAARRPKSGDAVSDLTPRGFGNFIESICHYLRKEVAEPTLGEYSERFVPYVWSCFFFVLFCNLLGLIPLAPITKPLMKSAFGIDHGIGGTCTGNIFVTGTLAVCTLVMVVFNGLRLGGVHYLAHFCPGPLWLAPLLVPVEIIGLLAKIMALCIRLFANMVAGHILLAVLVSFIGMAAVGLGSAGGILIAIPVVLGGVGITLLEIFVAFLQAFIFTFLTALFIGLAVVFEHEEQAEHAAAETH